MRGALTGRQAAACAAALALAFVLNAGCEITTFGNLTTTSTGSGSGGTGGSGTGSSSSGSHAVGNSFVLASGGAAKQKPAIAYADNSTSGRRFVLFWEDGESDPSSSTIQGRQVVFNSDGTLQDSAPITLSATSRSVRNPAVAVLDPNRTEMLVVWQDKPAVGAGVNRILARRIVRDGAALRADGGESVVSDSPKDCIQPSVAAGNNPTQYLVVYSEREDGTGIYKMRARRVSPSAAPNLPSFAIGLDGVDTRTPPNIAYNGLTNEQLILWSKGEAANSNIVSVRIPNAAVTSPQSDNPPISPGITVSALAARVAYNRGGRNEYLGVWRENGLSGNLKISRQQIRAAGTPFTSVENLSLDRPGADLPAVSYGTVGSLDFYLVCWQDSRTGDPDIRAQFLKYGTGEALVNHENVDFAVASGGAQQIQACAAHDPTNANWIVAWNESSSIRCQRVKP